MTEAKGNPFEWGPYIQVAGFCEYVLREADNVRSVIRLIDQINHSVRGEDVPEEMPEFHYPIWLVLCLKCGKSRGRHELQIVPELPSGETMPPIAISVQMEGEGKGANVLSKIDIPYRMEGLYYFIVRFDGILLTRLPLEIRYSRQVVASPPTKKE